MEYLWTPWRMTYVSGRADESLPQPAQDAEEATMPDADEPQPSTGCIFCDCVRLSPRHDRDNLVLLRGTRNFIILNLYPYNSGHLMVVPYEHTSDFASLDADTVAEMMSLVQRMLRALEAEYGPEGYNMGMNMGRVAGAGVADHVHMHLVPRWAGDTNFMPIVGATKVMPELLDRTYDRLKRRLSSL